MDWYQIVNYFLNYSLVHFTLHALLRFQSFLPFKAYVLKELTSYRFWFFHNWKGNYGKIKGRRKLISSGFWTHVTI